MSEWLAPGIVLAVVTAVLAAAKFGWVEMPSAKANAEATRIESADRLIGMVEKRLDASERRLDESEKRGDRLEERVETLEDGLLLHVRPLITWLDAGAHPPPPAVSDHLRSLLAEIRQNRL